MSEYGSESIQILEGLEAVRKRPGMYIGTTDARGLHHLVWEIMDNSIDEALAGHCDEIILTILKDNSIRVDDNGRGIPVDIHTKTGKSTVETIMTTLHAGGKFDDSNYKVSGGLHGVGASVVNALSKHLIVEINKNGKIYRQEFEYGKPLYDLKITGDTDKVGTTIIFTPDETIFKETTIYSYKNLSMRVRELAYLNRGIQITIRDDREDERRETVYKYAGGIKEYVRYLNLDKKPIHDDIISCNGVHNDIEIDIAFQYTDSYKDKYLSFANNINTHEGGTHVEGFNRTILRNIINYAKKANKLKKEEKIQSDDIKEGLTAVISIKHGDPQFEGQTKGKLSNSDVREAVSRVVFEKFEEYILENPTEIDKIIEKIKMSARARLAAKKAREATRRKSPLDTIGFASKLADCRSKDPNESEIFIVEGDSAGGSAKQGRESAFQAILPLRGKVLNVEKSVASKILENNEIKSLVQAFGAGLLDNMELDKLKYKKIIIMTDADVDGAHIRVLLLTFFFRYMRPLIEKGYIYIAQPPLFKVSKGKQIEYVYMEEELSDVVEQMGGKVNLQRYKGLGEMNPEQLWETTMDPETRILLKVEIEDAEAAEKTFEMLMGTTVDDRRNFIQENATYAKNIFV